MKRFSLTSLWNSVRHSSLTSEPENIRAEDLEPRVKYWMRSTIQNSININFHQRYSFHKFYSPLKMEQVRISRFKFYFKTLANVLLLLSSMTSARRLGFLLHLQFAATYPFDLPLHSAEERSPRARAQPRYTLGHVRFYRQHCCNSNTLWRI